MTETATAPELQVAGDLVRRALPIAAVLIGVSAIIWGAAGAASAGYAVALVVLNFLAAAGLIAWGASRGETTLMAAVLGGYIVRLGLVLLALWLVQDAAWVEKVPLFVTLLVTHVGLLVWETRYVSLSLAYPGLKPAKEAVKS
jgi:hypothetical protein